jgi:MFS family permease
VSGESGRVRLRLDPALLALVGEGLLSRLSFGVISFALPLFARKLGLSLAEVGLLAGLNSIVCVATKPLMGWAADRFGVRRAFICAVLLRSAISLLLVLASAPWQLFAVRVVHGLAMAMRDPAASVLLAERGGEKKVASAFAWYQSAKSVGGSLGKGISGVLLALLAGSYPAVFGVACALSALPLLVVVRYVKEPAHEPRAARPHAAHVKPHQRPVARYTLLGFLVAATAEMFTQLFPVLATEYAHLSTVQAGLIVTASSAVSVLSGPAFGWLADHVSRRLVLGVRGVANVLSSALYLAFPSFAGVGLAKGFDDLGKAAFRPAWGALMAEVASQDRRSRARTMSLISMGEDAGEALGPALAGVLWSAWGIPAVVGARILLALVSEAYAATMAPTRRPSVAPPQEVLPFPSEARAPHADPSVPNGESVNQPR